jgi:hypothetical protein
MAGTYPASGLGALTALNTIFHSADDARWAGRQLPSLAVRRSGTHPADDPAADAGAGAVATARDSAFIRRVNIIRLSSVAFA